MDKAEIKAFRKRMCDTCGVPHKGMYNPTCIKCFNGWLALHWEPPQASQNERGSDD